MQNDLGITLKGFVVFTVKLEVKSFSIYYRKIQRMLKSFGNIKFKILSVIKHFEA